VFSSFLSSFPLISEEFCHNSLFNIAMTQLFLHLKEKPCFLSKLQIAPITDLSYALSKSTDGVYQKVFPPNPRGIFETLRFLGTVFCEINSMCK
jgi:hypothetical protein